VSDNSFDESGQLKDGALKNVVVQLAAAFAGWVDLIVRGRRLLAEDAAHNAPAS
jgi:chromate reductase